MSSPIEYNRTSRWKIEEREEKNVGQVSKFSRHDAFLAAADTERSVRTEEAVVNPLGGCLKSQNMILTYLKTQELIVYDGDMLAYLFAVGERPCFNVRFGQKFFSIDLYVSLSPLRYWCAYISFPKSSVISQLISCQRAGQSCQLQARSTSPATILLCSAIRAKRCKAIGVSRNLRTVSSCSIA